jgi:uncharacterized protein involved in response to NO
MLKLESAGPPPTRAPAAFALWNLGSRPFYLLASVFAALSVVLWTCEYAGYLPAGYLRIPVWHGHEMLFGCTLAVVTGFLFTAVRNWTGQPTPTGALLAAYAALWVAGSEQVLHGAQEVAGMGLMGLGGLIAVVGGVLFVFVVLEAMLRRTPPGMRVRSGRVEKLSP